MEPRPSPPNRTRARTPGLKITYKTIFENVGVAMAVIDEDMTIALPCQFGILKIVRAASRGNSGCEVDPIYP